MNRTELTFGIPVYNSGKFIKDLLDCFKENSSVNYEVLIIDDGSTDDSFKICSEFDNSHFRVLHQKNGGVSSARNCIINNANGKWITFIDSDDLIDFDEYIRVFEEVVKEGINYDYFFGVSKRDKYNALMKSSNRISYVIENELINSPCNKFYKTSILKENKIQFDTNFSLGEDFLFNLNYYSYSKEPCFFYSKMYKIRVLNNQSLSRRFYDNKFEKKMIINNKCVEMFDNPKVLKSLEFIRIKNCFSCVMDTIKFPEKFDNVKDYIKKMKNYKKKKYHVLNSIKTTLIYGLWFFMSEGQIHFIIKQYCLLRKKV